MVVDCAQRVVEDWSENFVVRTGWCTTAELAEAAVVKIVAETVDVVMFRTAPAGSMPEGSLLRAHY